MAVARGLARVAKITPTLDTAVYASGDLMTSAAVEIKGAVAGPGTCSIVESICVSDSAKQLQAFDILFFSKQITNFGTINSTVDISASDMASYYLGKVSIATTDFAAAAFTNVSEASKSAIGLLIQANQAPPPITSQTATNPGMGSVSALGSANTSVWVVLVSRGTGTYTASSMTIKIGLLQE